MDEDFAFDYGDSFSGYDFGDSGYEEPFNYEPEGYQNPAWDEPEHYAYQPPVDYSAYNQLPTIESGGNFVAAGSGGGDTPEGKGNYAGLGQWGDPEADKKKQNGLRDYAGSNNNNNTDRSTYRRTGSTTTGTTTKKFLGELPVFSAPSLDMPVWDNEKIKRLRQSKANSGISSLRNTANRAITLSRSSQTGYAARQSLRDALAGYGTGISKIMKEADTEASTEYGREFTAGANKAQQEYNAKFQVANTMYQAALQEYLNNFITETSNTTSDVYSYFSA